MSGSSFDYLFSKMEQGEGLDSFLRWSPELIQWLERALGGTPGHIDQQVVTNMINGVTADLERASRKLKVLVDVAHSVEWYRSGDSGEDAVAEAVKECAEAIRTGKAR